MYLNYYLEKLNKVVDCSKVRKCFDDLTVSLKMINSSIELNEDRIFDFVAQSMDSDEGFDMFDWIAEYSEKNRLNLTDSDAGAIAYKFEELECEIQDMLQSFYNQTNIGLDIVSKKTARGEVVGFFQVNTDNVIDFIVEQKSVSI